MPLRVLDSALARIVKVLSVKTKGGVLFPPRQWLESRVLRYLAMNGPGTMVWAIPAICCEGELQVVHPAKAEGKGRLIEATPTQSLLSRPDACLAQRQNNRLPQTDRLVVAFPCNPVVASSHVNTAYLQHPLMNCTQHREWGVETRPPVLST
jgi:hypothetical protein